jgi:hypothetical protein
MLKLLVSVEVKHSKEFVKFDSEYRIDGYFQTFGITASNEEELEKLIIDYLDADMKSTLVKIEERWIPNFSGRDKYLKKLVGEINTKGIWYVSGKAWFSPDLD